MVSGAFLGDTDLIGHGYFTGDTFLTLGGDSVLLADIFFSDLVGDTVFIIGETDFLETDFFADAYDLAGDFICSSTTY